MKPGHIDTTNIFETIFSLMPESTILMDDNFVLMEANKSFLDTFNMTLQDIRGKEFLKLMRIGEVEAEQIQELLISGINENRNIRFEAFIHIGEDSGIWAIVDNRFFQYHGETLCITVLNDFSSQKKEEDELRLGDERVRNFFDNANDLIQSIAPDGSIIYANLKWLDVLGYKSEDLAALNIADIIRDDQIPHFFTILNQVKLGIKFELVETIFKAKDGHQVYVEGNIDGNFEYGKFISTRGIFRDVTQRRTVEEIYSLLVRNIPMPIYIVQNGVFCFVNPSFQSVTDYSETELLGKESLSLVHPEDMVFVQKNHIMMLKANKPANYEFRLIQKNGEVRWVMETVISIPYEGGSATLGTLVDFTERKMVEDALQESRSRYQILFNSAGDAIYIHDFQGKILEVNEAACKLLGYSRTQLLKMSLTDIKLRDCATLIPQILQQIKDKGVHIGESTDRHSGGKLIPVETHSTLINYNKKQEVMTLAQDITERKQIEIIRKRNEARLESLLKISEIKTGIAQELLDIALEEAIKLTESKIGFIYYYNSNKQELSFNSWSKEILKLSHTKRTIPNCQLNQTGILGEVIRQNKPITVNIPEPPALQKNGYPEGNYQLTNCLYLPVLRGKEIVAVVGVANKNSEYNDIDTQQLALLMDSVWDITVRKKMENELQESEQKYKLLVENQTDLLTEITASGEFLFINPAFLKLLGKNKEGLRDVNFHSLIHQDNRECALKDIEPAMAPPYTCFIETRMETRLGWRWIAWNCNAVLDNKGKITALTCMGRDITEGKQGKEDLEKANQGLRELDKLKDNFLSTVSHELRTPLTSIKSFVEILLNYDEDKATQKEFLGIINEESDRLTRLINDFLDLSKIQAGRIQWKVEELSMADSINSAVNNARPLIEKEKLQITISLEPDLPYVLCDKDRLLQVITNILGNAIKFTPESGKISIRAWVNKAEDKGKNQVTVSITDTGIGIAPENHTRIFENFGQVGDVLKDRPKGTGLGLPICKKIVENYGGKIWVESALGKGTSFLFTLPAVSGKNTVEIKPEKPIPAAPVARGKTILVVDDEANIRLFLKHELLVKGHNVIEASGGEEAVDLARKYHPDLITLDVIMPDLDGFDVTAVLKNDPETKNIPILIISIVGDMQKAYRLGANDYITKPVNMETLIQKVNHLLEGSQKKILIVDDDEAVTTSLSFELRKHGFATHISHNGKQALAAVEESYPDLIILDIKMPEMDGLEVIRALKNKQDTINIPVIIMTGIDIDGGRVKALSIGATDYINKTEGFSRLIESVERVAAEKARK